MAKFMTVTFGKEKGEVAVFNRNYKNFKAQMKYSKKVLEQERKRVMEELWQTFRASNDIEESVNVLADVAEMKRAKISVNRRKGTIKYLDVTIKIIKKE